MGTDTYAFVEHCSKPIIMKVVIAALVLLVALTATGELLAALKALQSSQAFKDLSVHDEILLTDMIAAAETCKLGKFDAGVGRPAITKLLSHIGNTTQEQNLETYLKNHIQAEQNGTCTVA